MLIGRVIGEVVATRKHPSHEDRKALLVQPLELDGRPWRHPVVALDAAGAGLGDLVLLATEGFSAMTAVGRMFAPIEAAVIGIIDRIDLVTEEAPPRAAGQDQAEHYDPQ